MGGGYYTIIIIMLSCEWVGITTRYTPRHLGGKLDIYYLHLLFTAFTVYTPAKAREHCYCLSYYVGCSCVDRNRYCTEYKKSWRTHSSGKQSFRSAISPQQIHHHQPCIAIAIRYIYTATSRVAAAYEHLAPFTCREEVKAGTRDCVT